MFIESDYRSLFVGVFMNDYRSPRIWVDADACPRPIKEVLYKAADRRKIDVIFVSNHYYSYFSSSWSSNNKTLLDKEWFINLFDSLTVF